MIDNNCEKIGVQEMNYVSPPPPPSPPIQLVYIYLNITGLMSGLILSNT